MVNLYDILKIKEEEFSKQKRYKKKHYEGQPIRYSVYIDYKFYKSFYNEAQMNRHFTTIRYNRAAKNKKVCIFERDLKKILSNL